MSFFINQVHIGPLWVPVYITFLFSALLTGSLVIFFLYRKNKNVRHRFFDTLSSAILIMFVVWKLFPIFTSFHTVFQHPLTLLYTPGGLRGTGFGILSGIVYFLFKIFIVKKNSNKNKRLLKPFIVFMGILIVTSTLLMGISRYLNTGEPQQPAPVFQARLFSGKLLSLPDMRGKTVILNFWATWCPPCKAEIPVLNTFADTLKGTNTILIGINATSSEKSPEAVERFIKLKGITYPVIPDTKGLIAAEYGIITLPTSVVISGNGSIIEKHTGVVNSIWLRSYVTVFDGSGEK